MTRLQELAWVLVRAQGKMLDKWSEGDGAVKHDLWKALQKAGDELREYLTADDEHYPGKHHQPLFDLMQKEHGLTLLASEMNDIIDCVGKLNNQEWIAAKDKLPEVGEIVLCFRETNIQDIFIQDVGAFAFYAPCVWGCTELDNWHVTHWRSLPEPPTK